MSEDILEWKINGRYQSALLWRLWNCWCD